MKTVSRRLKSPNRGWGGMAGRRTRRSLSPCVAVFGLANHMVDVARWIPDTRVGDWLIGTDVWFRYVLRVALADLVHLLGNRAASYATILDVGCGAGRALPLLDRVFKPTRLVGLDPDPGMIERALREAERCRCRVDLRLGCATPLDLPDAWVDMIFCHQTFHHLPDPEDAAREFHRVLRPGGTLLFAESCAPFIRSLPIKILFRHPMHAQRTADEYVRLLRSTGFEFTEETVSTPYPPWSRPDFGIRELLGRPAPTTRKETALNVVAFKGR